MTVGQTVLLPGEETRAVVTVEIEGSGPLVTSASLATNDPASPLLHLTLYGHVPPDVVIRPDRLRIAVDRGEPYQRTLRLQGPEGMEVTAVLSRDAVVAVAWEPIDAAPEGMRAWKVTLTLAAGLPVGHHPDELQVRTTHAQRPLITVPVAVEIRSSYVVIPTSAFFGLLGRGVAKTVSIKVRSRDGRDFQIAGAATKHPAMTAQVRPASTDEWWVDVTCRSQELGVVDSTLVLTTDLEGEERLEVPLYADVQAAR